MGSIKDFNHGANGDIDTTAEQLSTRKTATTIGVLIRASIGNAGIVYVGKEGVTAGTTDATDGFELGAGESLTIEIDRVDKVWVIASEANQRVSWLVV